MEKVKLGIVGLRRLGRKHAENIRYNIPEAELTAICSVGETELDTVSNQMHPLHVTKDYNELLAYPELDGIFIASSSLEHCSMICVAAEAGKKYVYTEKPLGMTLEEIDRIKHTVNSNGGMKLQIGYNRRFDSSVQARKRRKRDLSARLSRYV